MADVFDDSVPEKKIKSDLEKYREKSIQMGATDAKIITADMVVIDDRVLAKCTYPKCPGYGTNINCPPYAMTPDQVRKVVGNFRFGILVKSEVPSHDIAGDEAREQNLTAPYIRKLNEIIAKIEAEAFYDGYHLALAFGNGSCKQMFCPDTVCRALEPGQSCPHRLKARSPMEAVGIDCYKMAAGAGWDIYPIGRTTSPAEVPFGLRLALALIT